MSARTLLWSLIVLAPGCFGEPPDDALDLEIVDEEADELGLWAGEPGRGRFSIDGLEMELAYRTVGEHRLLEGDIVLDDEIELGPEEDGVAVAALYAVTSDSRLWPRGVVPYTIDDSVSTPGRVRDAMRVWEATGIRFVRRTTQRAYVTFIEDPGHSVCSAQVGYDGTRQYVYLRDTRRYSACNLGVVVHEIGHVLGLWHEHTRSDRDERVRVVWSNVPSDHRDAFEIMRARRVGGYDITSTMHYRSYTLTDGGGASIVRRDGRLLLHDWATISRGDVAAIRALYFDGTPVPRDAGPTPTDAPVARDAGPAPDAGPLVAADAGPIPLPDAGIALPHPPRPSEPMEARAMAGGCSVAAGQRAGSWWVAGLLGLLIAARRLL